MHALALTHEQLRAIATVTAFASRDEVTPVITGVRLGNTAGRITVTATDRYRVAELSFDAPEQLGDAMGAQESMQARLEPFAAITIPAAFLARVVKQLPRRPVVPTATIALMVTDDGHRITLRDRIAGFESSDAPIRGNYPPVARLFPDTLDTLEPFAGEVRLNAAFLASLEKLSLPSDIGARSAEKVYGMRTWVADDYSPLKARPVIFTRDNNPRQAPLESIRAMIQPSMPLR